jgi:Sulfotransferase family
MAEASAQGVAQEGPPVSSASGRPAVIYVMGAGHSGSTILGVALGNCEGVFYAGELEEWLVSAGESPIGGTERTQFWRRVGEGVRDARAIFGAQANRCIERSSSILRPGRLLVRRRISSRYRRVAEDLLRSVSRIAGASIIVDSSHFPLRARELKRLAGIDLYLVFLVRDPQGVVSSELRAIHRHNVAERRVRTLALNASLWLTTMLAVSVFRAHPRERRLFLAHEDFLADPAGAVGRILEMVGSQAPPPDFAALRTGFPLLANKLIDAEQVSLRDAGGPPPRQSLLTALLQSPWAPVLSRLSPRVETSPADRRSASAGAHPTRS